jgi:hypothetical protein
VANNADVPYDGRSVAQRADRERGNGGPRRRDRAARGEADEERTGSSEQPLQLHQRDGIAQRQPLRQVRVDRPGRARADERGCSNAVDPQRARCDRQRSGARGDERKGCPAVSCQVLAEDEDGEKDGKGRLEVQDERPDESGDAREPDEQEQWSNDSTGRHDRKEQADVGSS